MTNKEKIDNLSIDAKQLEMVISEMKDAEFYPATFFEQAFQLGHKILKDLNTLEVSQLENLRKQLEEHQRIIDSIPVKESTKIYAPTPATDTNCMEETPLETISDSQTISDKETFSEDNKRVEYNSNKDNGETFEETTIETPQTIISSNETEINTVHRPSISCEKSNVSLNDILEKKNLSDFRKAFSLNDRFRFRRELFGGDEDKMNKVIADLNQLCSYEDSIAYINNVLKWNTEEASVADFIKLLEKRFS